MTTYIPFFNLRRERSLVAQKNASFILASFPPKTPKLNKRKRTADGSGIDKRGKQEAC